MAPKYRSDIVGNIKAHISDFEFGVKNEVERGENFIFSVEDTEAFREYGDWLTLAEMKAAFKRAVGFKSVEVAA